MEVLEASLQIVKYLHGRGGVSIKRLSEELGLSYPKASRYVDALAALGLVEKHLQGMPRKGTIRLAEKGLCLAQCLKKCRNLGETEEL